MFYKNEYLPKILASGWYLLLYIPRREQMDKCIQKQQEAGCTEKRPASLEHDIIVNIRIIRNLVFATLDY